MRHHLLPTLSLLLAACAATIRDDGAKPLMQPYQGIEDWCPVTISTPAAEYDTAGHVRIDIMPSDTEQILGAEPWPGGFTAVKASGGMNEPRLRRDTASIGPVKPYPLSWGMPTSVWDAVRSRIGPNQYEVPPGTYQIIVRYRGNDMVMCQAATGPFTIKQSTLVVSTGDGQ